MTLTVKYERRDFFNQKLYTEDKTTRATKDDVKKAFTFFNKDAGVTLVINDLVIFWDSYSDFENKVVTVRAFEGWNYSEDKKAFEILKKEVYKTA